MIVCVAGRNDIAVDVIKQLLKIIDKNQIKVITSKKDEGKNFFQSSFKNFCELKGLQNVQLEDVYEIEDLVFFSLEFDEIIKPDRFKSKKLYNIHFSLLPKYKGMYTSAWPILNGESCTGVSLHEIDAGIDTGDIIAQVKFNIEITDTAKTLYLKYIKEGTSLVNSFLEKILYGDYKKIKQNQYSSTYFDKYSIDYSNLKINFKATAYQIQNQIRAFSFRDYQLPEVHGYKIRQSVLLNNKSIQKPGAIVQDNKEFLIISSIDYNLKLYKDYFEEFCLACQYNDLIKVTDLFKFIPDIEEKNRNGWNSLIIAVYNNSLGVAEFLLNKGANVNATNYNGTSVLMYAKTAALKEKSIQILDLVLKYEPLIEHKDYKGKNVLDYTEDEDINIYKYLLKHQNDRIS
jgi:methionyl-tRNA formyltransferase